MIHAPREMACLDRFRLNVRGDNATQKDDLPRRIGIALEHESSIRYPLRSSVSTFFAKNFRSASFVASSIAR